MDYVREQYPVPRSNACCGPRLGEAVDTDLRLELYTPARVAHYIIHMYNAKTLQQFQDKQTLEEQGCKILAREKQRLELSEQPESRPFTNYCRIGQTSRCTVVRLV